MHHLIISLIEKKDLLLSTDISPWEYSKKGKAIQRTAELTATIKMISLSKM